MVFWLYFSEWLKHKVFLGGGFFSEYWGSYSIQDHTPLVWKHPAPQNALLHCIRRLATSPETKPLYDEATCGNALSAVLNFHPAPSKYLPSVSSLLQPWFHHRICSRCRAARRRSGLEAAVEPNVCIVETGEIWLIKEAWPVESRLILMVLCLCVAVSEDQS